MTFCMFVYLYLSLPVSFTHSMQSHKFNMSGSKFSTWVSSCRCLHEFGLPPRNTSDSRRSFSMGLLTAMRAVRVLQHSVMPSCVTQAIEMVRSLGHDNGSPSAGSRPAKKGRGSHSIIVSWEVVGKAYPSSIHMKDEYLAAVRIVTQSSNGL